MNVINWVSQWFKFLDISKIPHPVGYKEIIVIDEINELDKIDISHWRKRSKSDSSSEETSSNSDLSEKEVCKQDKRYTLCSKKSRKPKRMSMHEDALESMSLPNSYRSINSLVKQETNGWEFSLLRPDSPRVQIKTEWEYRSETKDFTQEEMKSNLATKVVPVVEQSAISKSTKAHICIIWHNQARTISLYLERLRIRIIVTQ